MEILYQSPENRSRADLKNVVYTVRLFGESRAIESTSELSHVDDSKS
jgi:hypothetical protein